MIVSEPQPTEFWKAVREGDLLTLTRMIDAEPALAHAKYYNAVSPIDLAMFCGRFGMIKPLLDHGADPSTAILIAVAIGDADTVRMLLDAGADPDTSDGRVTLLGIAAESGQADVIRALLEKGADPNLRDQEGETPLFRALNNFDPDIAGLLIAAGADVNARDDKSRTPLFYAMENGMSMVVRQLLDVGADPTVKNLEGQTPLSFAFRPCAADAVGRYTDENLDEVEWIDVKAGRREAVQCLVERVGTGALTIFDAAALGNTDRLVEWLDRQPELVNAVDGFDFAPIQHAAAAGHTDTVDILLARGAHVDSHSSETRTPLALAAMNGHAETARFLVKSCADVRMKDDLDSTPLHEAASTKCPDLVELLLENGADPNARDGDTNMPLHLVTEEGPESVRLLINAGADVNARGFGGDTPLHVASDPMSVRLLVAAGADIHARNEQGETPLLGATKWGANDVVKAILEAGEPSVFDIAALGNLDMLKERLRQDMSLLYAGDTDRHNRTLLHYAAETDQPVVATYLLDQSIDANVADDEGITPLHLAAESSGSAVAEILIAHGGIVDAKDIDSGYTPLHEAAYHRNVRVAELLLSHGADANVHAEAGDTPLNQAEGDAMRQLLWRAGGYYNDPHGR